jgi:hypothetical protein
LSRDVQVSLAARWEAIVAEVRRLLTVHRRNPRVLGTDFHRLELLLPLDGFGHHFDRRFSSHTVLQEDPFLLAADFWQDYERAELSWNSIPHPPQD